jgi:hypothetical protein
MSQTGPPKTYNLKPITYNRERGRPDSGLAGKAYFPVTNGTAV